jgi:phosphatidylglycerophosphatase A
LAPGTYGSALACVFIYLFPRVFTDIILIVLLTAGALIAMNQCINPGEDPGYIVMDEFVGMLLCMAGHKVTILNIGIGFLLFRFFDIVKPFPIRQIQGLRKGYGVIADDVVAGIFASLLLLLWGRIRS